jgi:hypothetical protein
MQIVRVFDVVSFVVLYFDCFCYGWCCFSYVTGSEDFHFHVAVGVDPEAFLSANLVV